MTGDSGKRNFSKRHKSMRCCSEMKIQFSTTIGNHLPQIELAYRKRSRTIDGSRTCPRHKKLRNYTEDDNEDEHNVPFVKDKKVHFCDILDKAPTYPNGLRKDINFYSNMTFKFVVAKKGRIMLHSIDFNTLNSNGQSDGRLSNFLMEYLCEIIVPSTIQVILYEAYLIVENVGECIEFTKEIVFLPLVKHNHWVLFIINTVEATFTYLNSMPMGHDYFDQDFSQNFKRYVKRYNQKFEKKLPEEWRKKPYLIDYQHDGKACGAFVADYIRQYIETGKVTKRGMNADECRTELQLKCLELSDDMRSMCLICGTELEKCLKCKFQCKECKRWMHTKCFQNFVEKFKCEDELCCLCLRR